METLSVAVLGTGSIGMRHLRVLPAIPGVRVLGVPVRPSRVCELREAGYLAARDLSESRIMGATLCIVATDTGRHVQDALMAMEKEFDVLVEKPLATDFQRANYLCLKAKEDGRKVFVGYVLRFSESLNKFRELLTGIGRLHSVRIECQSYLPDWRPDRSYLESYSSRADEGGVLRDLSHEIDYAGWIFGWPKAVDGYIRNLGRLGIQADEAADLMWEGPDGCVVSVSLDYLSRPSRRRMTATGEGGTLEWDGMENTVTLTLPEGPSEVIRVSQNSDEVFMAQGSAFIQAASGLQESRLATAEEGIKVLAVCDAVRQSSRMRRTEPVQYS